MLRRATELQEKAGTQRERLSLQEVREIAGEMGIAPEHLARAAVEASSGDEGSDGARGPDFLTRLVGGPFRATASAPFSPGSEDELWENMLLELRRHTGHHGQTSSLDRSQSWSDHAVTERGFTLTDATMRKGEDATDILVENRYAVLAAGYVPSMVLGFFLLGFATFALTGANPIASGAGLAGVLSGALAYRSFLRFWRERQASRLQGMLERVQRLAGSARGALKAERQPESQAEHRPDPASGEEPVIATDHRDEFDGLLEAEEADAEAPKPTSERLRQG
jgi:hypothetical protein